MVRLVRAMVSLMSAVIGGNGCTWSLHIAETIPVNGLWLGTNTVVPGILVLEIITDSGSMQTRHLIGYWSSRA
jgi:hypothetical protein